jgi:hypothetical protein
MKKMIGKLMTKLADTDDKWYFTGKPCKNGHIDFRFKSNRICKTCSYERREKYETSVAYTEWKKNNKKKVSAKWQKNNKGTVNANTRKRQAALLKRTPSWLTSFDILKMKCFYQVAAMRSVDSGQAWHVDHIVPLQGDSVCGLHVPWNLQIIPASENLRKYNKHG